MTRGRYRGVTRLGASLGVLALTLTAACTPGSGSDGGNEPGTSASDVETDVAKMGELTLTVWDQEVRGGQNAQITRLNKEFQKKYPNVTIKRVSRSFDDLKTTLKLALSGNDAPDVVEANNGRSDMGAFVQAGMLEPLDSYAAAYDWTDRYPSSVLSYARYSPDGSTFGEGNLYGMPQMGEVVGVYYDKAKLDALGIEPPETWDDFTTALATAKKHGEIPIQFGNLDKWPAIHLLGTVQSRTQNPQKIRDLAFGRPGASWTDEPNVQAARTLQHWVDAGYLTPGFNGVGYDPSWQAFGKGEGVFLVSGTWLLADLSKALGDDLGFMLPPGAEGATQVATGGTSLPFAVTAKSKHPDAAAAYVDYLTSAHAMDVLAETGNLPAVGAGRATTHSAAQADVFDAWDAVTAQDGLVPYLDYATPTFYDTLTAALQDLLAEKVTPAEFTQRLEDEYQGFLAKNGG